MIINSHTQTDLVKQEQAKQETIFEDRIEVPGITTLHKKSKEEVATVVANLLKSRPNIKQLKYVVGEGFYVTWEKH